MPEHAEGSEETSQTRLKERPKVSAKIYIHNLKVISNRVKVCARGVAWCARGVRVVCAWCRVFALKTFQEPQDSRVSRGSMIITI